MAYNCEYAQRDSRWRFVTCSKLYPGGKEPTNTHEASQCICAFQRYCGMTKRYEVADDPGRVCAVYQGK